jgi:hypothetical protein
MFKCRQCDWKGEDVTEHANEARHTDFEEEYTVVSSF